jgi:hypothetical protein
MQFGRYRYFLVTFTFIITLGATKGFAQAPLEGYPEAAKICQALTYAADRVDCLEKIKGKRFKTAAVAICESLKYNADRVSCLVEIMEKTFTSEELATCADLKYAADRVDCLKKFAVAWPPAEKPIGNAERWIKLLSEAKDQIRQDKKVDALKSLETVIKGLEEDLNQPK